MFFFFPDSHTKPVNAQFGQNIEFFDVTGFVA